MPKYKKIQTLSQLANLKNFGSLFNPETISSHIVLSLLKEGKRIIQEAYDKRDWNNRTYNLYNSYVAAVIHNGQVLGWEYLGPEHAPDPKYAGFKSPTVRPYKSGDIQSGREEAINFVLSYASQHRSKKISLIVGAAMFYAGILESKGYHVIAGIEENMQDIKAKGLILTDFKVGSMYKEFGIGSNAALKIGSNHIAYRNDIQVEKEDRDSRRKGTFNTKLK